MTALAVAYRELLVEDLPHAIHNERDYKKYVARVEALLDQRKRSPAQERYVDLLSVLIERYEEEVDEEIAPPSPLDALKELMLANGFSQADLGRLFGSSGVASEVLAGRRAISKEQIRKISTRFNVSAASFI